MHEQVVMQPLCSERNDAFEITLMTQMLNLSLSPKRSISALQSSSW